MRDTASSRPGGLLPKKFGINFLGYGYTQLVTLAVQFISIPFFLHQWGSTRYAEWLVITGIPMMLGLLDLGVSHASASKATMLAARGLANEVRRCLQTSLWFSAGMAAIIVGAAALLSPAIDWKHLLKLSTVSNREVELILVIMLVHLGTGLVSGSINAWFRAMDRTALGIFLHANRRLLDVILTIAALSLGADPLQLAATLLSGQAVYLLLMLLVAVTLSPWHVLGIGATSWSELASIFRPAMAHVGITAGQVATLQGSLQLLNQISNAETVVAFSLARTLMRLILQIGVVSNLALRPELSRLIATGNGRQAEKFTRWVSVASASVALAAYLILIIYGPYFVKIWSRGHIIATTPMLSIIGLHAFINVIWYVPTALQMASNSHARISVVYFIASAFALLALASLPDVLPPIISASFVLTLPEVAAGLWAAYMTRRFARDPTHDTHDSGPKQ